MQGEWISLADAALRLGIDRERLLRLVQGQVIDGRRNVTGRWEVSTRSMARYRREQEAQKATDTHS